MDGFNTNSAWYSTINSRYQAMLMYPPYSDRFTFYTGEGFFYLDAYAVYVDSGQNDAGAGTQHILRNSGGSPCYIPWGGPTAGHPYPQYAADVGNPAFRDLMVSYITQKLADYPHYDGVYLDDVNLDLSRVSCGNQSGSGNNSSPIDPRTGKVTISGDSKDYLAARHKTFEWGTSAVIPVANMLNTFPYRNRTAGRNPHFEGLDGARIRESFEKRGGGMHNCMNGCIVKCSNMVHDKDGNYVTSALEFETLTLLGSCCDINDWEEVAILDRLCDELGMDTIEIGAAIAVLMDSGGMQWGDANAAKALLKDEIAKGTDLGVLVANGVSSVGRKRGHHRVPVVKGQAVPAWDPRSMKATGVTYATSAMGADHTAGLVINPAIGGEAAVLASQESQIVNAVCDSSGFCLFLQPSIDEIRQFYNAFFGDELSNEALADMGWQCLQEEWEFNRRAGFSSEDDDMVKCLREEGIGPDNAIKFDIPRDLLAKAKVRQPVSDTLFYGTAAG